MALSCRCHHNDRAVRDIMTRLAGGVYLAQTLVTKVYDLWVSRQTHTHTVYMLCKM